jgi:hypothetical protein
MNIKFLSLVVLATSMLTGLQGCASEALSDADAEEQITTEADLTANAARLVGSFKFEDGGVRVAPPRFLTLKFNADGTYSADIDTGIRCITTPCRSGAQIFGRYSATASYLTLRAGAGSDTAYTGRYKYVLAIGRETGVQKITLSNHVGLSSSWSNTVSKIADVWPSNATKLVAETHGGGFRPPPPAGSTCNIGSKYTFDVATNTLAWERCGWVDASTPMHMKSGVSALLADQVVKINDAANSVTVSNASICGTDKGLLTISVSTATSTKTYTDSFYSCRGGSGTYVNDIDGVFRALYNASL